MIKKCPRASIEAIGALGLTSQKGRLWESTLFVNRMDLLSSDIFLNLRCLTYTVTQIVQLGTSYLTGADGVNLGNVGGVDGESLLNAYAVGNTSYGEGLGDTAAVLSDNGAFEHLDSFLVTLFDLVVHANGVTNVDRGNLILQLLVCKSLNQIHYGPP